MSEDELYEKAGRISKLMAERSAENWARVAESSRGELRDRFAMAALTGLVARGRSTFVGMAEDAYHYAEAMLAERDR